MSMMTRTADLEMRAVDEGQAEGWAGGRSSPRLWLKIGYEVPAAGLADVN